FFKKRVFLLYMFVCVSGTILIAYACQFLFFNPGVDLGNPLLKGVATLSGGESGVIRKGGPNVRMVMDPGGKGIIATYADDIDGRGQVVFDGCAGRFKQVFPGQDDNGRYIENIAQWLGQDGAGKGVLVYGLSGDGAKPLPVEGVRAVLGRKGFRLRVTDRRETPRLTRQLLSQFGQVWLFFGGSGGIGLSGEEVQEMTRYNAAGGGMVIVADGLAGASEANPLSSRFGVTFSGSVDNRQKLPVTAWPSLLTQGSEWVGRLLKMVGKA
ncbi:MAG TPA: permease, partial [Geobacteraceae bacterium]